MFLFVCLCVRVRVCVALQDDTREISFPLQSVFALETWQQSTLVTLTGCHSSHMTSSLTWWWKTLHLVLLLQ
jgi:hypothetical protein